MSGSFSARNPENLAAFSFRTICPQACRARVEEGRGGQGRWGGAWKRGRQAGCAPGAPAPAPPRRSRAYARHTTGSTLRSLPPIPSPGRCSWPRTSLLIFQCTAPELCQRATHSLRSARPHGARPAVPMAAVAFLHHAPLATTKKPIAVPRSRAARADVPVIDGRLPRQRRLLNRAILQASSEAISWPSDSIAVGVYLHRLPGADPT